MNSSERDDLETRVAQAIAAHQRGEFAVAEATYLATLATEPEHFDALHYLGLLRHQQGNNEIAMELLNKALAVNPHAPNLSYNRGVILQAMGRRAEAIAAYRQTLALQNHYPLAYSNLGTLLRLEGELEQAKQCYQEALRQDPNCAEALNNLGVIARTENDHEAVIEHCQRALALNPRLVESHVNLAYAYGGLNRLGDALQAIRTAVGMDMDDRLITEHSALIMHLHYMDEFSPQSIFDEHRIWAQRYADPLTPRNPVFSNVRDPERRLRVGYVSQDFFLHSVAYFFESLSANHDHSQFEIFCYSNVKNPDYVTERLKTQVDHWREVRDLKDEQLAEFIRRDEIDILVDLSGHTPGNRLLAFARKPAPIQMTGIGYPDTTGMRAMDYRITDAWCDPVGISDPLHSETLLRLAHGFLAYRPHDFATEVAPAPALKNGYVTFGSFNLWLKVSPATIALWVRILHEVPNSRLLLKYKKLDDPAVRKSIVEKFVEQGISEERLILLGHSATPIEHLRCYEQMDIALDPFPYNGTTTTCEAMWMGVPVITLAGDSHVSRVGVSLLNAAGMPQLVANNEQEYVALAAALASDHQQLATLRASMRDLLAQSPLTNGPLLTQSLEQAYRAIWQDYCRQAQ